MKKAYAGSALILHPSSLILHPSSFPSLPFHCAFFRGVDLGLLGGGQRFVEEEPFDVVEQEIVRVGVGEVQTVVIDNLSLLLQPGSPARLADFCRDALPELVWKRRKANRR